MVRRLELVKEILGKPIWLYLTLAWGIATNLPSAISFIGTILHQDVTGYESALMESPIFSFLRVYWLPLLVIVYLAAVADGLFRKFRPFLGETIKVNLEIMPFVQPGQYYLSLILINHESGLRFYGSLFLNKFELSVDPC